jgi:hypothetical protein
MKDIPDVIADRFELIESVLHPEGPEYRFIETYSLD